MRALPQRDDRGATAAEYALLAAAVAALVVAVVMALGQHVYRVYDSSCRSVGAESTPATACE